MDEPILRNENIENNLEVNETVSDETPQCLLPDLVNGILDVMASQFNAEGDQQSNRNSCHHKAVSTNPTNCSEERRVTEPEESASSLILKKLTRKRSVKPSVDRQPSCSKDGAESDESSPLVPKEIESSGSKPPEEFKKSNRRRSSREFSESVVKNAIARKEKSFTLTTEQVKRPCSTRPLKPTRKVLDNLAAASQKRGSKSKEKNVEDLEGDNKKLPKRSRNSPRNGKKVKLDESDDESFNSDNDTLLVNLTKNSTENSEVAQIATRRSTRISSAASKKDDDTPKNFSEEATHPSLPNEKDPKDTLVSACEQLIQRRICLCATNTNIFVKKDKVTVYCEALDNIDGKIVGCSRTLNPIKVTASRPSLRIPYSLYCNMHKQRLKLHNCCPTCGIFCTQGTFSECVNKHHYHTECHLLIGEKICCPHCGLSIPTRKVKLTLECDESIMTDDKYIPKQRRTISSEKSSAANQNAPNSSHVTNTNNVTNSTTNQQLTNTPENSSNNANKINTLYHLQISPPVNKSVDVPSKFHKLMSRMEISSCSIDVNATASVVNLKKKMAARYKNPLEVSSVKNLIAIENLEQQNDEVGDHVEPSFDLDTISDSILHEKYGQLRCLLDYPSSPPIDLSLPYAYPAQLSPFSCPSPNSTHGTHAPTILGTVVHYACALGRTSAVRMIVKAYQQRAEDLTELLLLMDSDQSTPLVVALASGKNDCARVLLESGQSNILVRAADGMSPLHIAARSGNLTGCELLLAHASRILPHSARRYLNSPDDGGWTALIWAAEHAHADVVAHLLARGADRMRRDVEHNMAVHWACYAGHVDVLNVLLEDGEGVEGEWMLEMVNAVNIQGDTPLHLAAHQAHTACTQQLLAHGAEPGLSNKMHETPLDLITDTESEDYRMIAKYMQRYSVITKGDKAQTEVVQHQGNTVNGVVEAGRVNGDSNKGGLGPTKCRNRMLLNNDISRGRESNPIQLINCVDGSAEPRDYTYIATCCLTTDNVRIDTRITSLGHCKCSATKIVSCLKTYDVDDGGGGGGIGGGRNDVVVNECECLRNEGGTRVWYDVDGRLVKGFNFHDPPSIFECNDRCSCNSLTCGNRVVQKNGSLMNSLVRTQVFRTKNRGWALRTLQNISQGSYVCEYVGEVLNDRDVNLRPDDSYVFDLDSTDSELYCIDAKFYGNMSRFINHSCQPNLVPVKVFTNHQDLRFPRIAFFANQNIRANDELSFDYGYKFWIIKYKSFTCECGSKKCKYSKDTIAATLERSCKTALTTITTCNGH